MLLPMELSRVCPGLTGSAGYMRESRVEQLMRDSKILQIYAGTDEVSTVPLP